VPSLPAKWCPPNVTELTAHRVLRSPPGTLNRCRSAGRGLADSVTEGPSQYGTGEMVAGGYNP
jgi:hypothetical protein